MNNNRILVGQYPKDLCKKLFITFETVNIDIDLSYPIHESLNKTDVKHPICEKNNYWVICHERELSTIKKFIKKHHAS